MAKQKKKTKKRLRLGRLVISLTLVVALFGGLIFGGTKVWRMLMPVISQIGNDETTAPINTISHQKEVEEIKKKNALDQADVTGFSDRELRDCFFSTDLDDKLKQRLVNMGWTEANIAPEQLAYLRVLYRDFDNNTVIGEIMVNKEIAAAVQEVFFDLYIHKYQIGKMILADAYGTRISESYADNNTVGLCFGLTADNQADFHARGYAIDINPLYNPLIKDNGNSLSVFPMEGQLYLDRTVNYNHFINENDYAVTAFRNAGFNWRGAVAGLNDYKHFEWGAIPANVAPVEPEPAPTQENTQPSEEAPMEQAPIVDEPVYNEPIEDGTQVVDPSYPTEDPNSYPLEEGVNPNYGDEPIVDDPLANEPIY